MVAGQSKSNATWQKSGPTFGLGYLIKELLGLTNERGGFVNLSDGGHFENLGIYELVRRRCRFIVACDAEEDHDLGFGGLGNAIRKCREDFGMKIEIDVGQIRSSADTKLSKSHCVVGKIKYPDRPGVDGIHVYLKSSLTGDEPEDVGKNSNFITRNVHMTARRTNGSRSRNFRAIDSWAAMLLRKPLSLPGRRNSHRRRRTRMDFF